MRGRKKTPANLVLLRNNPGKRQVNKDEPKLELGAPEPPAFLNEIEKRWWSYHAPELANKGILAKLDIGIFASYCSALADLEIASEQLLKPSDYTQDTLTGGFKKSPWVMIRKEAREQIKALGAELGLSATSRARIKVTPKDNPQGAKRFLA
jgi:P27 family predicted phage terminase small subunit